MNNNSNSTLAHPCHFRQESAIRCTDTNAPGVGLFLWPIWCQPTDHHNMNSDPGLKHLRQPLQFISLHIGSIGALVCFLATANLFSPPLFAQGTLAISSMISGGEGCADCVTDTFQLSFGMVYGRGAPDVALFDSLALRTNDVNRLLVFTPAQGEGFTSFVR